MTKQYAEVFQSELKWEPPPKWARDNTQETKLFWLTNEEKIDILTNCYF